MKQKIISIGSVIILVLSFFNALVLFVPSVNASDPQPQWPTPMSWILIDTDPVESEQKAFRDVQYAYYSLDESYLYFRVECYGFPDFSVNEDCRYKWFIDTDDPYNMDWSGGNVIEAEYMLFVEDTDDDGDGEVYLLNDTDSDGNFSEWEGPPDYWYNRIITNENVANYSISGKNVSLWIKLENIDNPAYAYFTWSTDQENSNLNQAPTTDRSDTYFADLSKADLSITKHDSPDPVAAGETLTYTLNVTNHGPHPAENVNVTDILPAEVYFVSAVSVPPADDSGISGSTHWWKYDSLYQGNSNSIIITITVTVNNGVTGNIVNEAHVYNDTYDPLPGNNNDNEITNIIEVYTLTINTNGNGTVT
ncbi:MAG: DUF11 domain-containing protein, partial [Thermoplasmatales archaeon]|nr:DUF11 domain-containing protein [Thermoplasmatales archaeon]